MEYTHKPKYVKLKDLADLDNFASDVLNIQIKINQNQEIKIVNIRR